jgi:hypothetical protein
MRDFLGQLATRPSAGDGAAMGRGRALKLAALPTLVVAVVYGLFIALFVLDDHPVEHVAHVGTVFLDHGEGASSRIDAMRPYAFRGDGYDGQFSLYMALDLPRAPEYIPEDTSYRLTRMVYPLTASALALGQAELVPWTLLLVNVTAALVATFLLALYLVRTGASPMWALVVGGAPGLFVGVAFDTTEPLAYALVVAACVVSLRNRIVAGGVLFGLAAATREVSLLFPLAWALWLVTARRYRDAATLLILSILPLLIIRAALAAWIGYEAVPYEAVAPFTGFDPSDNRAAVTVGVLIPSILAAVLVGLMRRLDPRVLALIANILVLVVLLPARSWIDYHAAGRITLGVLVAFCLCVPLIPQRARPLALVPAAGWMLPWIVDPSAVVGVFPS